MKKLRVWWIPQVGADMNPFYIPVDSVENARKCMDILAAYDLFQLKNNIKPDFCNTGGLEEYDESEQEWVEWHGDSYEDSFDDVDEYIDTLDNASEFEKFTKFLLEQSL